MGTWQVTSRRWALVTNSVIPQVPWLGLLMNEALVIDQFPSTQGGHRGPTGGHSGFGGWCNSVWHMCSRRHSQWASSIGKWRFQGASRGHALVTLEITTGYFIPELSFPSLCGTDWNDHVTLCRHELETSPRWPSFLLALWHTAPTKVDLTEGVDHAVGVYEEPKGAAWNSESNPAKINSCWLEQLWMSSYGF
jgi:hypothetical protein